MARSASAERRGALARARLVAATQRDEASRDREEAARVRDEAARIRADAARVRDDAARARDAAARVRDDAARVRDEAARIREAVLAFREEATRQLLLQSPNDLEAWREMLRAGARASEQSRAASAHDREAARLDRTAADRDREAAEMDRNAATKDRDAADHDRDAAEKDRQGAEKDRLAAEADRDAAEEERELGEQRLDLSEKLATLGKLAAGLAHEMSTPLASVGYNLDLLRQELEGEIGPETRTRIRELLDETKLARERMAHVLADTKAWLSEEGDRGVASSVDFVDVVDRAVRLSRPLLPTGATLTTSLVETAVVSGFSARLGQVVTNLLVNAMQASRGPEQPNTIEVQLTTSPAAAVLSVIDTGRGIAPEDVGRVFDAFFTNRGPAGLGLGLALCKDIVSAHRGVISVSSVLGEGTTFRVELPLASSAAVVVPQPPPVDAQASGRRARALLIDDDDSLRRVLVRLLRRDADVDVAANGREGLERILAATVPYDVILCDLMMPVMGGIGLHAALTRERPALLATLVLLTGGATTDETRAFLKDIPNLVLEKPVPIDVLSSLIRERASRTPPLG